MLNHNSYNFGSEGDFDGKLVFEGDGGDQPGGGRDSMYRRIRGLQALVKRKGASLILLGDAPVLPHRMPMCAYSLQAASQCDNSRSVVDGQMAVERAFYSELALQASAHAQPCMPPSSRSRVT